MLGDGRGANKPWLQELPDPVTKVLLELVGRDPSARPRARLGIERGDIVEVKTRARQGARAGVPLSRHSPGHDRARDRAGTSRRRRRSTTFEPKQRRTRHDAVGLRPLRARHRRQRARPARRVGTDAAGGLALVTHEGDAREDRRPRDARPAPKARRASTDAASRRRSVTQLAELRQTRARAQEPTKAGGARGDRRASASHAFLPGLRSPVAADAQGELGSPTSARPGQEQGDVRPRTTGRAWRSVAGR